MTIPNIHLACACVVDIDSESGDRELWVVLESKHDDEAVDIYSVKKALRALLPLHGPQSGSLSALPCHGTQMEKLTVLL